MKFSIYIDESGEAGISKVRDGNNKGASPYFVLGAVVCQGTSLIHARNAIIEFRKQSNRTAWKHATDLSHFEKVFLARELGRLPVRYFAVVSRKKTLSEYKTLIDDDPQKYYNKCLKYLLETICQYLGRYTADPDDLTFFLEERNHNYDKMYRYLDRVKCNPIYPQSNSLELLNPFSITTKKKGSDDVLEVADFVAHAVFQCTNRSQGNFGIPEPRYFKEISRCFAGDSKNFALGCGLKCLHSIEDIGLDLEIQKMFETLVVKPRSG